MTRRFRIMAALLAFAVLSAAGPAVATPAPHSVAARVEAFSPFIADAAARFDLPATWIAAVLRAESAGDARAVSRAGALGLMQLMPATWQDLRLRLGLGDDPFDPRDNILAGAAYLRELYDRYGPGGFLAAYNAGPERYAAHLRGEGQLPAETRAYLATLAPRLDLPSTSNAPADPPDWRRASLFAVRAASLPNAGETAPGVTAEASSPRGSHPEPSLRERLFVPPSTPSPRPLP